MAQILNGVTTVLSDHEHRLRRLEDIELITELDLLRSKIIATSGPGKQSEALVAFKNLCDLLGFPDLESTN